MAKNAQELKEEVKKLIRAVLESAPHGIYLHNFIREYKTCVQEELQFRKLGYSSLEELFSDIRDTAVLTSTNRGPLITVVASEKTVQLERMVRGQKKNSNYKGYSVPKVPPVHVSQVMQQQSQNNTQRMPHKIRPFFWEQNPPQRFQPPQFWEQPYMQQQSYHPFMQSNTYTNQYPPPMNRNQPYRHPGLLPHPQFGQNRGMCYNEERHHYGPPPPLLQPLPIPQQVRTHITALLQQFPSGLTAEEFGMRFKSTFNYSIFPEMFNCRNLQEVMLSCSDIVLLRNTGSKILYLSKENNGKPQSTKSVDLPPSNVQPAIQSLLKENAIPGQLLKQSEGVAKIPLTKSSSEVEERAPPKRHQNAPEYFVPEHSTVNSSRGSEGVLRESNIGVLNAPTNAMNSTLRDSFGSLPRDEQSSSNRPCMVSLGNPVPAQKSTSTSYIEDKPMSKKLDEHLTFDKKKEKTSSNDPLPLSSPSCAKKVTSSSYIQDETMNDPSRQYLMSDRIGKVEKPSIAPSYFKKTVSSSCSQDETLDDKPHHYMQSDKVGDNMKAIFQKILEKHPNGIWPAELLKYYKEHTGNRLDFRELGFWSALELAYSIPDVFKLKESKKIRDFLLLPASRSTPCYDSGTESISQESRSAKVFVKTMRPQVKISPELKKKLMQVICSCKDGIVLSEFEVLYKRLQGEDLNLDSLERCYTAEALFLALPDLVLLDYVNAKKIVVRATTEGKSLVALPTDFLMPYTCPKPSSFPEDAVTTMVKLPQEGYPTNGPEDYFSVNVSFVESPQKFFVRLGHTDDKFQLLMMQMKMLYHSPGLSRQYFIPNHLICPSRICAALYAGDQNWCRAVIIGIKDDDMVEVYYLDVGNIDYVHRTKLRFLKKEFTLLPAQALGATLFRAVPVNGPTWESTAVRRFVYLCLDKLLVASLTAIKDGMLLLSLCDTSSEKDIHMLDTLVSEGYACLAACSNHINPKQEMQSPFKEHSPMAKAKGATARKSSGQHRRNLSGLNTHVSRFSLSDPSPSSPVNSVSTNESAGESCCTIIPAVVKKQEFHIIRLNDNVYVPVFELSSIFWERDLLAEMVRIAGIVVNFFIVKKLTCPAIFKKLSRLLSEYNPDASEICLCPLSRVPDIIFALSPSQEELHRGFVELITFHNAN